MASLLRHSRSMISRFATAQRTAATSVVPANHAGAGATVRQRLLAADAIKLRPVGEAPLV